MDCFYFNLIFVLSRQSSTSSEGHTQSSTDPDYLTDPLLHGESL